MFGLFGYKNGIEKPECLGAAALYILFSALQTKDETPIFHLALISNTVRDRLFFIKRMLL